MLTSICLRWVSSHDLLAGAPWRLFWFLMWSKWLARQVQACCWPISGDWQETLLCCVWSRRTSSQLLRAVWGISQRAKCAKAAKLATALCGCSRFRTWPICGLKHVSKLKNLLSNHVQNNSYLQHKTTVSLDLHRYNAQVFAGHYSCAATFCTCWTIQLGSRSQWAKHIRHGRMRESIGAMLSLASLAHRLCATSV